MLNNLLRISLLCLMLFAAQLQAAESTIYKLSIKAPMGKVYPAVYAALEESKFWVVFEAPISKNLQRFSSQWGKDYNQSKLTAIRSMVFCNGWYANAVSNADPDMLALCPLRLGLYEKQGQTTVVFARPTVIAAQSPARGVLQEVENGVIHAIETAAGRLGH